MLNKPISVGFTVLELSKLIMYRFYYDHLKPKYGDRCKLLFTDTDSFCCEIQTRDLYADMADNLDLYDTSNFDPEHPQYSTQNHRVLGKFKKCTVCTYQTMTSNARFVLRAKRYHTSKRTYVTVNFSTYCNIRNPPKSISFVSVKTPCPVNGRTTESLSECLRR